MNELGKMVKEMTEGITEELKGMLPEVDLSPDIPDKKIKQAILDLTPVGMGQLFSQFGQAEVTEFITDFSRGRQW